MRAIFQEDSRSQAVEDLSDFAIEVGSSLGKAMTMKIGLQKLFLFEKSKYFEQQFRNDSKCIVNDIPIIYFFRFLVFLYLFRMNEILSLYRLISNYSIFFL